MCVCVCGFTFWLSSLLMAKASWSCSSSSPLVCGRACSRSEAARGDEDEAADGKKWWSLREVSKMAHVEEWSDWRGVAGDTGSVGLIWIISGGHCSIDNLCAGLSKVLGYSTNCISLGDQPEYKCVFLTPDPIIHTLPIHEINCAPCKISTYSPWFCNNDDRVKAAAHNDEPTENYHLNLQLPSALWSLILSSSSLFSCPVCNLTVLARCHS